MNDQPATTSAASDLEEPGYERGVHENGKAWVRVPLKKPLQRADNKYTSVVLTEPHGSDYQGTSLSFVAQGDYNALITVIPRISEPVIHKQDLQAMKASDLAAVSGEVIAFFYTDAQRAALGLTA